jgi:tRNA pseudouridine38-40 synthase
MLRPTHCLQRLDAHSLQQISPLHTFSSGHSRHSLRQHSIHRPARQGCVWREDQPVLVGGCLHHPAGFLLYQKQLLHRIKSSGRRNCSADGDSFTTQDCREEEEHYKKSLDEDEDKEEGGAEGREARITTMQNHKAVISYDGTSYSGFQLQLGSEPPPLDKNGTVNVSMKKRRGKNNTMPTIQGQLEHALTTVTQQPREVLKIQAAGRTDAGVHARAQVIQFWTLTYHNKNKKMDTGRICYAVNSLLPADIRMKSLQEVPSSFNARYASSKTYYYDIHLDKIENPLYRRYRYHPKKSASWLLDVEKMREVAQLFVGTHDFEAFCKQSEDNAKHSTFRTVKSIELEELPECGIRFVIKGSGFLHRQCRHMVGALLAVAAAEGEGGGGGERGRGVVLITREEIVQRLTNKETFLDTPGKALGYHVAEARGLCLAECVYDEHDVTVGEESWRETWRVGECRRIR